MVLDIVTGENNSILRTISDPVLKFDKELKKLVKNMQETVTAKNGLGLAAPQVGVNKRVFLMKIGNQFLTVINPQIISFSQETEIAEEGCLSLPDIWGNVPRAKAIVLEFQNIKGQKQVLQFEDMEAREAQHEFDHLDGVLFTDKLELPNLKHDNKL